MGILVRSKATDPSGQGASAAIAATEPRKNPKLPNIGDPFNPYGMFSGIWIPESLLKYSALSPSAKLLYGRLARFAGENGRCFPIPRLRVRLRPLSFWSGLKTRREAGR